MAQAVELPINIGASATQMAQTIFGSGVTVVNASYTGDIRSSGIYYNGDTVSPGVAPSSTGVILSTGQARDFTSGGPAGSTNTNTSAGKSTNTFGPSNRPDFNAAVGARTYDASFLDVDFIPTGDTITMQFVFASEEYPEYQSSLYQDFVAVWVNGVVSELGVGDGDIDPRNVNNVRNENLFKNNTGDQYNTEMDGFTVSMSLKMKVTPGQVNSIRIGIADVLDAYFDSNLLIAADSIQTSLLANADTLNLNPDAQMTFDVLANDQNTTGGTLTITQINGVDVSPGDSVVLTTGQEVMLNANGTLSITGNGDEESVNFTYTVTSSTGVDDVGIVTLNSDDDVSVACFVAGTQMKTPSGLRPIHMLKPGDLVWTRDNGPRPVRWIGRREVPARGDLAPVRIAAGALGDHQTIMVSPQHRVLVQDELAHLLFETPEVLAAAKHLVNDQTIRVVEGGTVEYIHILFDEHQIVSANGLLSESFLPGSQIADMFEAATLAEITQIFPELDPQSGDGYGPAARRVLKRHEAALLTQGQVA
jgi:hypothetical protein